MDRDHLMDLGKGTGIGGIALGVALLVFGKVLRKSVLGGLSEVNAYRLLRAAPQPAGSKAPVPV